MPARAPDSAALERLTGGFSATWGGLPTHVVRAPGRVNLMGEHIDYCHLPVLPAALGRGVWLAFRVTDGPTIRIATDLDDLEPRVFDAAGPIPPGPPGDWGNYARAAVEALASSRVAGGAASSGIDAFVTSTLPVAAGLSSSSALVVACALAWLAAQGRRPVPLEGPGPGVSRLALARRLAAGERYVGTAGGGMDQTASLLGRAGHALRIEFEPLSATPVPIPPAWRIVVADTGERARKSGGARTAYNDRTRETAQAVASIWAASGGQVPPGGALASVPTLLARHDTGELWDLADRALDGVGAMRFRHVITEARRVDEAEQALRASDLEAFGRLLLESHASLRDNYVVSTEILDHLVEEAVAAGAVGARLTGAGFGGCVVAVCTDRAVDGLVDRLAWRDDGPPRTVFVAEPADGAEVREL